MVRVGPTHLLYTVRSKTGHTSPRQSPASWHLRAQKHRLPQKARPIQQHGLALELQHRHAACLQDPQAGGHRALAAQVLACRGQAGSLGKLSPYLPYPALRMPPSSSRHPSTPELLFPPHARTCYQVLWPQLLCHQLLQLHLQALQQVHLAHHVHSDVRSHLKGRPAQGKEGRRESECEHLWCGAGWGVEM